MVNIALTCNSRACNGFMTISGEITSPDSRFSIKKELNDFNIFILNVGYPGFS